MKVYAFIGASGTGKSYRALLVAKEKGIDYIIDDGLLISGNRVIAGSSAKKERTRIASVKRALFVDPGHAQDVIDALSSANAESVLILGTSEGMVESIVKRLGLSEISERIYIEQVATPDEIQKALFIRRNEGKHVIPVPTFELKKDFSGYLLNPLRIFRRRGKGNYQLIGEKSVVRPTYSYRGNYTISDTAICQIAHYNASKFPDVARIVGIRVEKMQDGIYMEMGLDLYFGGNLRKTAEDVQASVIREVERLTALNILKMDVVVRKVTIKAVEKNNAK